MKIYVFDASIIVSVILEENPKIFDEVSSVLKEARQKQCQIYTTEFFNFEIANAFKYNSRNRYEVKKYLNRTMRIPLQIYKFNTDQMEQVVDMAYKADGTIYDAAYHYLAYILNGQLWTCDKKYFEKAKMSGYIRYVE